MPAEFIQPLRERNSQPHDEVVPEEWLSRFDAHAKEVEEYQKRLQGDAELLGMLQFSGFSGPAWDELATTLAEYGYQVVRAWITSGHIYGLCAKRHISVSAIGDDHRRVPREHQVEDLTQDTISLAIERFRARVLIPRRWTPEGGASLKTFFIGQALFCFGDVFRKWTLAERRQQRAADGVGFDHTSHMASTAVAPLDQLVQQELIEDAMTIVDDQTKAIILLTAHGYEQSLIAEMLGISARAVEGKLYRYRKHLEGRHAVA